MIPLLTVARASGKADFSKSWECPSKDEKAFQQPADVNRKLIQRLLAKAVFFRSGQ